MKQADYVFFIDESFENWFNFKIEDGNFCHAGISVPMDKVSDLKLFVSSLISEIEKCFRNLYSSAELTEIKYTHVKKLPDNIKTHIANKIRYFCRKNQAFCFGFYSERTPFLYNRLRDKYFDCKIPLTEKIKNIQSEIDDIIKELQSEKQSQSKRLGETFILKDTYLKLTQFALNFHKSIGKTFVIQYDPRQRKEDIALNDAAVDLADMASKNLMKRDKVLLGYDTSLASEDCPGLMLADFIAGDLRTLFQRHASLMSTNSSLEILAADDPRNRIPCPISPLGVAPFKPKHCPEQIIKDVTNDTLNMRTMLDNSSGSSSGTSWA